MNAFIAAIARAIAALFGRRPAAPPDTGPATVTVTPAPPPASGGYPLTAAHLTAVFPTLERAEEWAAALREASVIGGMTTKRRMACFLAVCSHETGGFKAQAENMNYSVAGLINGFGRHRISIAEANEIGRTPDRPANQMAIANTLYGGAWGAANLGNTQPGDGWRFRGRGLLQVTGRSHYESVAQQAGIPLDDVDDFLITIRGSAVGSAVIWQKLDGNRLSDTGDFPALVKRMNGGDKGLSERTAYLARWEAVLP